LANGGKKEEIGKAYAPPAARSQSTAEFENMYEDSGPAAASTTVSSGSSKSWDGSANDMGQMGLPSMGQKGRWDASMYAEGEGSGGGGGGHTGGGGENMMPDQSWAAAGAGGVDQWGNPIMMDQWGNPIMMDQWGNPMMLDQWGNPMVDQWGNPMVGSFDQWGNPIFPMGFGGGPWGGGGGPAMGGWGGGGPRGGYGGRGFRGNWAGGPRGNWGGPRGGAGGFRGGGRGGGWQPRGGGHDQSSLNSRGGGNSLIYESRGSGFDNNAAVKKTNPKVQVRHFDILKIRVPVLVIIYCILPVFFKVICSKTKYAKWPRLFHFNVYLCLIFRRNQAKIHEMASLTNRVVILVHYHFVIIFSLPVYVS
jgi:hypothetical protein